MNPESANPDPRAAETIFNAALAFDAAQRPAYLAGACWNEPLLRQRVEALLRAHEAGPGFLPDEPNTPGRPTIKLEFADAPEEEPGKNIGRYKLLQKIGEGGCGVVYMAEQREPVRRRVALKIIKLGMDTKSVVARFEAERQALALMDHPNIAKVLDAGATESGRPYFVMELVKGIPITRHCDENNLSTESRLNLFVQVCQAIQHAHQKGIIHRDIKPSNVLVADHDGIPVPKIIDFGIAKATTDQRLTDKTLFTAFEQFIGTPAYMSPEQARLSGLDIDTRSDIYSLGVLLYELLTGKTPFESKRLLEAGLDEIRRIIREEEPVRPSTRLHTLDAAEQTTVARHRQCDPPKLAHLISGDLDWIVMKALEKDRARRYETASGLAADLKRYLDNEPVVARPPSPAYRLQKAFRRNRLAFGAGAVVVLALMAGLTVAALGWRQTRAERDRALQARAGEEMQRKAAQASEEKTKAREAELARLLYAADMNLAEQAWDQNNITRLRQLLTETRDAEYHGFEWYYWQRQTHRAVLTLRGRIPFRVPSVAFSPDGRQIVTAASDFNSPAVWDAASGRELLTLKGHALIVMSVTFSPDGRRIATGSMDGTVKLWDAASGRELLTFNANQGQVLSVAFSPDGRRIATGGRSDVAMVWDAATGKELLALKGHTGPMIYSVAFSPDGQQIATGGIDATAKVWNAATGELLLTLKGHHLQVCSVAFSPDGRRILTASYDETAKVWNAATGESLLTLKGHSGFINSAAFSPDSQRIVTGSQDQTAKLWDAATGRELSTFKGHREGILSVAFSPDGRRFATSSFDGTTRVWEAAGDQGSVALKLPGGISPVAFSPDGRRMVTCLGGMPAEVWDAGSGRQLLELKEHSVGIDAAAFSADGRQIVTVGDPAHLWDAVSGKELMALNGHSGHISSVAFSPDGQRVLTGSWDGTAKVWDSASGKELLTIGGHDGWIYSVAFSPDGKRIVTGYQKGISKVWDAATGRELVVLKGHSAIVARAVFSPDGQWIVTGCWDGTANVWDAATGRELATFNGHTAQITAVAFSPDSRQILTGSADQAAKLWDAATGREMLTLNGHTGAVSAVAFSSDGRRIFTGRDGTARIWEAARPEQVAQWQAEEAAVMHK